eukprot:4535613-Prymnesium_polylepis.2
MGVVKCVTNAQVADEVPLEVKHHRIIPLVDVRHRQQRSAGHLFPRPAEGASEDAHVGDGVHRGDEGVGAAFTTGWPCE